MMSHDRSTLLSDWNRSSSGQPLAGSKRTSAAIGRSGKQVVDRVFGGFDGLAGDRVGVGLGVLGRVQIDTDIQDAEDPLIGSLAPETRVWASHADESQEVFENVVEICK